MSETLGSARPNPNLPKSYIYHIRVGNSLYIGQTDRGTSTRGGERITEHIYEAFYAQNPALKYQAMREERLMDWEISFYTDREGYGIPKFEDKYVDFCRHYSAKATKKGQVPNDEQSRLDFAEIYHILTATRESGIMLTNDEMGGKPQGYLCIDEKSPLYNQQVFFRHTNPFTAYQMATMNPNTVVIISGATELVYKEIFSPDWPKIYKEKYKDKLEAKYGYISDKITMTWDEFFSGPFIKKFTQELAKEVKEIFLKRGDRGSSFVPTIRKFVKKEFLDARKNVAKLIIQSFYDLHGFKIDYDLDKAFDFTEMTNYIGVALTRFLKGIAHLLLSDDPDDKASLADKLKESNLHTFIPVNITPSWNLSDFQTGPVFWLEGTYTPEGPQLHATPEYLKRRSYYVFRKAMNSDRVRHKYSDFVPYENYEMMMSRKGTKYERKNDDETPQRYSMSHTSSHNWLSHRVRKWYLDNAPGYAHGDWYTFYKPMIDIWRAKQGYGPFKPIMYNTLEDTREDGSDLWQDNYRNDKFYTNLLTQDGIVVYANENAADWGSGRFDTLTIY